MTRQAMLLASALVSIAVLGAAPTFAQAAPGYEKPKTSWGVPDLGGFWSNTSLTAMQRPPGAENLVMHAQFSAGPGAPMMGCDIPQGFGEGGMGGSSVFHAAPDAARAAEVFAALSDGGAVTMMLAPTFWSPTFGMLVDRWGTRWMISVAADAA